MAGLRVLIIDDDPIFQKLLSKFLKRVGAGMVMVASSGERGLKRMGVDETAGNKRAFDIIFVDIDMPGIDGLETVRRIRKDPDYDEIPLVMITADGRQETLQESYSAGANAFITKPLQKLHAISHLHSVVEWNKEIKRRLALEPVLALERERLAELERMIAGV